MLRPGAGAILASPFRSRFTDRPGRLSSHNRETY
jgi:hypothetical protein